jgi:hypothetical protein
VRAIHRRVPASGFAPQIDAPCLGRFGRNSLKTKKSDTREVKQLFQPTSRFSLFRNLKFAPIPSTKTCLIRVDESPA